MDIFKTQRIISRTNIRYRYGLSTAEAGFTAINCDLCFGIVSRVFAKVMNKMLEGDSDD